MKRSLIILASFYCLSIFVLIGFYFSYLSLSFTVYLFFYLQSLTYIYFASQPRRSNLNIWAKYFCIALSVFCIAIPDIRFYILESDLPFIHYILSAGLLFTILYLSAIKKHLFLLASFPIILSLEDITGWHSNIYISTFILMSTGISLLFYSFRKYKKGKYRNQISGLFLVVLSFLTTFFMPHLDLPRLNIFLLIVSLSVIITVLLVWMVFILKRS